MNCVKCGTYNNEGSKFCIKCGNNLEHVESTMDEVSMKETVNSSVAQESMSTLVNVNINTSLNVNDDIITNTKISFYEYFSIILMAILKPHKAYNEEISKFNKFKNSMVFSLIVSMLATVVSLIVTMFNSVRYVSWSGDVEWVWENLKNINYLQVIGKNFLIYLGIIFAIAVVFYIASLIAKKEIKFPKILGIATVSVTPLLICALVLSPIMSMIYVPLGMTISLIGGVYSIILLYEMTNAELKLEGNIKYYFNLICFSILIVSAYYLYVNILMESVSSSIGDIFDMFG